MKDSYLKTIFLNLISILIGVMIGILSSSQMRIQENIIEEFELPEKTPESSLSIANCNELFANTTDELSIFHPQVKNRRIKLYKGKEIIFDDVLFGYDVLFERSKRYASSSWLGVQMQQNPSDAMAIQMLVWDLKPDLIIDLGTNTGGSALYFASIMDYYNQNGKVITVDIKSYENNWVDNAEMFCKKCTNPQDSLLWKKYVTFILGATTDPKVVVQIKKYVSEAKVVFVSQDASHSARNVYQDLIAYSNFVTVGSYILVQDTKLDRFYRKGEKIIDYVEKFLKENDNFVIDREPELLFYYTHHPKGFLKRVK